MGPNCRWIKQAKSNFAGLDTPGSSLPLDWTGGKSHIEQTGFHGTGDHACSCEKLLKKRKEFQAYHGQPCLQRGGGQVTSF